MEDYIMNIQRSERVLETIPVGSLGIIALPSCKNLGKRVDDYLVQWRHESANQHKDNIVFQGYEQESYLLNAKVPRFGSGEAKGIVQESVRGRDLYLMVVYVTTVLLILCADMRTICPRTTIIRI